MGWAGAGGGSQGIWVGLYHPHLELPLPLPCPRTTDETEELRGSIDVSIVRVP